MAAFSSIKVIREASVYSLYVLFALLAAYLLNQLDRYTLAIVAKPLAQHLKFGDKACMANESNSFYANHSDRFKDECKGLFDSKSSGNDSDLWKRNHTTYLYPLKSLNGSSFMKEKLCYGYVSNFSTNVSGVEVYNTTEPCKWDYDGKGILYQVVAGPIFTLVYTIAGIPLGLAADRWNRVRILSMCLMLWSACTLVSGFATAYWNLALLRMGVAIGEAGCTPMASSIISDYFVESLRASALGIYNWGIYTGYSMSFALGNSVQTHLNWRWAFIISGIPGLVLGVIIWLTVKEPKRGASDQAQNSVKNATKAVTLPLSEKIRELFKLFFMSPSLLLLCIAGGVRNGGGYVWAYNTETFFENVKDQSPSQINHFMSWIPLVAGSLGVVVGGFISDRLVFGRSAYVRIWVLVVSQLLAAPFAAGALFLSPPLCYLSLIPSNVIGEMWVSVTMTVVLELVPVYLRTSSVAVYFFIITNIGGNVNPLVSVIKSRFGGTHDAYKLALLLMYPGLYVLGGLLFLLTLFVLKWDLKRKARMESEKVALLDGTDESNSEDEYDQAGTIQAESEEE